MEPSNAHFGSSYDCCAIVHSVMAKNTYIYICKQWQSTRYCRDNRSMHLHIILYNEWIILLIYSVNCGRFWKLYRIKIHVCNEGHWPQRLSFSRNVRCNCGNLERHFIDLDSGNGTSVKMKSYLLQPQQPRKTNHMRKMKIKENIKFIISVIFYYLQSIQQWQWNPILDP